jgi:hypothetical protein
MNTFKRKALLTVVLAGLAAAAFPESVNASSKGRVVILVTPWVATIHLRIYEGYQGYLHAMNPYGFNPAGLGVLFTHPPKVIIPTVTMYFPGWNREEMRPDVYLETRDLRRI